MSSGFLYENFFNNNMHLFSYIIGPLVKRIGEKFCILDIPDLRKIHKYPIVRIGGLSIFTTFSFITFYRKYYLNFNTFDNSSIINLSSLFNRRISVFLIGIHDDVYKSSPILRLFLQFLVAFFVSFLELILGL